MTEAQYKRARALISERDGLREHLELLSRSRNLWAAMTGPADMWERHKEEQSKFLNEELRRVEAEFAAL